MFVTSRMDFILFQFYKVCIKCLCVIISREDVRQIAKVHYDILTTSLSFPLTHTHTHTDTLSLRHTHTRLSGCFPTGGLWAVTRLAGSVGSSYKRSS